MPWFSVEVKTVNTLVVAVNSETQQQAEQTALEAASRNRTGGAYDMPQQVNCVPMMGGGGIRQLKALTEGPLISNVNPCGDKLEYFAPPQDCQPPKGVRAGLGLQQSNDTTRAHLVTNMFQAGLLDKPDAQALLPESYRPLQ